MTGNEGIQRVSVVGLSAGEVVFAPHTRVRWLTRDLTHHLGDECPEIGQVGVLDEDPSGWIFDVDPAWRVELRSISVAGSPESMSFRISGTKIIVDLTDHGVPLAMKGKAARLKFWWLVRNEGDAVQATRPAGRYGHFDHRDLACWVADTEKEAAAEKQQKQAAQLLHRKREVEQKARDHFVNPYTFVPFPEQPPARDEPQGHHTLGSTDDKARFSGRITARLVTRSPLLVRRVGSAAPVVDKDNKDDKDKVAKAPRTEAGELFIPGSSLHGAVRALHETLTGSCLRVFDPDFVPVYRDVASGVLRPGWALGVVEETNDKGRPTRLTRCSDTRWVPLTTLARAMPAGTPVTTGQRFRLAETDFALKNGRQVYEETASAARDPDGEWVVLVTDDSARNGKYPYYCAVGRFPATPATVALTERAWQTFRQAAEGAKQTFSGEPAPSLANERARLAQPGTDLGDVLGNDRTLVRGGLGRWLRPRQWLHPGQVVWLSPGKGGYVNEMALSYLWRTAGQGRAGERLPDQGFHPCHDPKDLCPSCRVFGSADVRDVSGYGVDRRMAEQRSYRGHVRVLDAVLESGGPLANPVVLPATGSPRPGSGQFYLDDPEAQNAKLVYQQPRNRWGTPDQRRPRRLRGRKFYWHTDPVTDERRRRWRAHESENVPVGEKVELVAADSVYRLELTFDGLTRAELGSVVAALQPDRLFATQPDPLPYPVTGGPPKYAIHVGGGKPLGLGSCQVNDLEIHAHTAESRYLDAARPELDPAEVVATFAAARAELSQTWQHVAAALHTEHVDSRIVSYPTAVPWADDDGACSGKHQHEAFDWFQQTTGEALRKSDRERPFVPLPPVWDIAPALPVHIEGNR